MISLQRSMHSSQMYTPGPAMSFLTCFWLFPQKEHFSRSPPSPIRATRTSPCSHETRRASWNYDGTAFGASADPLDGSDTARLSLLQSAADSSGAGAGADGEPARLSRLDHFVHKPVVHGCVRGQDIVAFDVLPDLVLGAAGVSREQRLEQRAHPQDLVGLDLDVAALSVAALRGRLVDDDPAVLEREALARRTGGKQHRGCARGLAEA